MSIVIALALLLSFIHFFHPDDSPMDPHRHRH